MTRCIFILKNDKYANLNADEFHEDGDILKAYKGTELVGYFNKDEVLIAYRSEEK
jgi:hypothetical protein